MWSSSSGHSGRLPRRWLLTPPGAGSPLWPVGPLQNPERADPDPRDRRHPFALTDSRIAWSSDITAEAWTSPGSLTSNRSTEILTHPFPTHDAMGDRCLPQVPQADLGSSQPLVHRVRDTYDRTASSRRHRFDGFNLFSCICEVCGAPTSASLEVDTSRARGRVPGNPPVCRSCRCRRQLRRLTFRLPRRHRPECSIGSPQTDRPGYPLAELPGPSSPRPPKVDKSGRIKVATCSHSRLCRLHSLTIIIP